MRIVNVRGSMLPIEGEQDVIDVVRDRCGDELADEVATLICKDGKKQKQTHVELTEAPTSHVVLDMLNELKAEVQDTTFVNKRALVKRLSAIEEYICKNM